jgi:hypothetical protein
MRVFTEELRDIISKAHKGIPLSEEHKRKISDAHKGKVRSEEHCRKLSEARKGIVFSEEHKRKLSESHKGQAAWNKGVPGKANSGSFQRGRNLGVPCSDAVKQKVSLKNSGSGNGMYGKHPKFSKEHGDKISAAKMGHTVSIEVRQKLSVSLSDRPRYDLRGELSPSWKGGITSENQIIRHSLETKAWRKSIFIRDNWTCQKCKIRGVILHPHHILGFSKYPELRFSVSNGVTLCATCHWQFHKQYGYFSNGKMDEFLIGGVTNG